MTTSIIQRVNSRLTSLAKNLRYGCFKGIKAMEASSFHQEIFEGQTFDIPHLVEYKSEKSVAFQGNRAIVPPAYIYEFTDAICITDREEVFTKNREVVTDITSQNVNPLLGKSRKITHKIDRRLKGKTLHLSLSHFEDNYYAYSVEFLARWWIFQKSGIEVDYIILPLRTRFQRELAEILQVNSSTIISEDGLTLQCEKLIVPSLINNHRIYQIGNQELYSKLWLPSWLKEAYKTVYKQTPQPAREDYNSQIYITRRNTSIGRRVKNEDELIDVLKKYEFDIVDLDNLSINEQIHIFGNAETIIAPHGAGLVNMSYCQRKARILELYPHRYHDNSFRLQSQLLKHDYHFIVDKNPTALFENHQYSDLTVDVKRVEAWILEYLPTRSLKERTEAATCHDGLHHALTTQ